MENKGQTLPKTLFPFIWHFLKDYKPAVAAYVGLALIAGFWGSLNSLLVKQLLNLLPHVTHGDTRILILPASLLVVNFIVLDNFTWRGISYINYRFLPFILNKIDNALLENTLRHSHQFFQERMAGTLSRHIFHLMDGIEKILSTRASHILRAVSLLSMSFIFSYSVNAVFLIVLMIWSVFFLYISLIMSKKLAILSEKQAAAESVLGGQITDSLTHSFSVTLFAHREQEITRRAAAMSDYTKAYQKQEMYALMMHALQGGLIAIMIAFGIYFLVHFYGKNLLTIGDFALILGLFMEAGHMMWHTTSHVDDFNKEAGRCNQSLLSLMHPFDIQDKPHATALSCTQGHITFDNVTFHYKESKPLFQNKSIEIKAGQKVGLVGYSGGGKSTFVNLILRFYDVIQGAVRIDGQDIRDVTQDTLRAHIAMIPQDPSLFHRSLMENIRYGRLDATDEEVIEAAQRAHIHEFITLLPQGYDTLVGERGMKLSGGQRQRLAMARALLKNAPILILDEATSQLDSVTEGLIQDSLWNLIQNQTTLVIAHRLSTLLHMDRILVFDKGKIVEDGAHNELLEKQGLYQSLWKAQVGGFLKENPLEEEI